ncbi:MAG: sensor histidine kinase [Nannocystales bacterium]
MKSTLSFRIYALGLLQIAVVLFGFGVVAQWDRPAPPDEMRRQEVSLASAVELDLHDAVSVQRHLDLALAEQGVEVEVFDHEDRRIATTIPEDAEPCVEVMGASPHDQPPPPPGPGNPPGGPPGGPPRGDGRAGVVTGPPPGSPRPFCYSLPIRSGAGLGKVVFRRVMPGMTSPFAPSVILLTLVTVAVASWLLMRSLVRPLQTLGNAAHALGKGDLAARTGMERDDELGEVAHAFDTMANRIEELVRGERELIANISHEFRTPLARIRVALDLAAESDSADDVRASLGDIVEDLEELDQLVSDVLDSARPVLDPQGASGTPTLHSKSFDGTQWLQASAERFAGLYPDRALEIELAAGAPLRGDPSLLRRMVDNLLDNAQKFSASDPRPISLSSRRVGEWLHIEVRDFGIGIGPEDLDRVFEPFFRADPSRARSTGGTGLGLGLARRIAHAHGGTLALESQVGVGTTARIRLPVADAEPRL